MTTYTPRHGDTIRLTAAVTGTESGVTYVAQEANGFRLDSDNLRAAIAAGKVELVARAEPDWQPGDIGVHVDNGIPFLYRPDRVSDPDAPWFDMTTPFHGYPWASRSALAGKLRKGRVVLVDEDEPVNPNAGPLPPTEQAWHSHQCPFAGHGWKHYAPGCTQDVLLVCSDEEHHQYVDEDEPAAPVGSHTHICAGGAERQPGGTPQDHEWTHRGAPECEAGEYFGCPDCGPAPNEPVQVPQLFTLDELIPDPNALQAVGDLLRDATASDGVRGFDPSPTQIVTGVCRVLRARGGDHG